MLKIAKINANLPAKYLNIYYYVYYCFFLMSSLQLPLLQGNFP